MKSMNRIICLFAVCFFVGFGGNAQPNGPWVNPDQTYTFKQYQEAFNAYWDGREPLKGEGFKQFKRWEYFWETRLMPDGSFPTPSFISKEMKGAKSGLSQNKTESVWEPMGPFDYQLTDSWSAGHGRINTIEVDPNDPNTLYIGAPSGGIWKSTDQGDTWTVLNDFMGVIGVSAIAIDPANSDIIYIGTGDDDAGDSYSIGVMKSMDGGSTWNQTGLTFTGTSARISNLVLDPENNQTLYAATNSGLFKSSNAGESFNEVLSGNIRDFAFKPGNPNVIYAVSSSRFYRSEDSGASFTEINSGLPDSDVSRIVIGVSADEPNYVYLLMAKGNSSYKGLYKSTNGGLDFSWINSDAGIFDGSSQAWYDLAMTIDPMDANTIYTGVLNVWKSTNGGNSFSQVNSWSAPTSNSYTHADIHYLGYHNNVLYCGSDGGIYRSFDGGAHFEDLSPGLQIGQFYEIDGAQANPEAIAGGLQDNGGYYTQTGADGWKCYYGADGMDCVIDYTNDNIVYGAIQFGGIYRSTNGGNSISGMGSPESGSWVTPIQLDPEDPTRLIGGYSNLWELQNGYWTQLSDFSFGGTLRTLEIAPSDPNIIYVSFGNSLYKTTNGGTTINALPLGASVMITDISIHNENPDKCWVTLGGWGSNNKVFKTENGGVTWTNITYNLPDFPVNCIAYQKNTNGGVYIGNDFGVYYYDDNLSVWIDYLTDLPRTIINDLYINYTDSTITAGTYGRGIWRSDLNASVLSDINLMAKSIDNLEHVVCDSVIQPTVTVRNIGMLPVTGFDLNYGVDGTEFTLNWTGNLESLTEVEIILDSLFPETGNHDFTVSIDNISEGVDADLSSNTRTQTFTLFKDSESLQMVFVTDCWGYESSWEIRDENEVLIALSGEFGNQVEYLENVCLGEGCYTLSVFDSYGDGVNGTSYGCSTDGYYALESESGDVIIEMENANFGYGISHDFCIGEVSLDVQVAFSSPTACEGTVIDFSDMSTGNPLSWFWEFEGGIPETSTEENPANVLYPMAGSFDVSLTITNSQGETATIILSDTITVYETPQVNITSILNVACFGEANGSVTIEASGGQPPYAYSIDGINSQAENVFVNLLAGDYNGGVVDDNNCFNFEPVSVSEPMALTLDATVQDEVEGNDGSISIDVSGGMSPYEFSWTNGMTGSEITGLTQGEYGVMVTDASGCTVEQTYVIVAVHVVNWAQDQFQIFPNPANDQLYINLENGIENFKIELYSSNGVKVLESEESMKKNIVLDVENLPAGSYLIRLGDGNQYQSIPLIISR